MTLTYDIYFNSGGTNPVFYKEGDNISLLEITDSDQDYYQNGLIVLYNVPSTQTIGDTIQIYINDTEQFNGYVVRKEESIDAGVKYYNYQLIGKTYNLWRHHTGSNVTYTDKTTSFIASSLVGKYCNNISGLTDVTTGVIIDGDITFDYETVGDALVKLTEYDGYKFYVDTDNYLNYYEVTSEGSAFSVEEADIISMNPVEESDEDIVNDVLVVGGSDYSEKTSVPLFTNSKVIAGDVYVAQKFKAESDRLSSIRTYLDRTRDPYKPDALDLEIWHNTERQIYDDHFTNTNYINTVVSDWNPINDNYTSNYEISGTYLIKEPHPEWPSDPDRYSITGMVETLCFSGQYTSEKPGFDCKYMKVTLYGISTQNILISGTNDSGATWATVTDGEWHDFGSENYAIKARFVFPSSAGIKTWTPGLDRATIDIADDSGGFEIEVFDDTFDSYTHLSSNSNDSNYMRIRDDKLELSGSTLDKEYIYADSVSDSYTGGTNTTISNIDNLLLPYSNSIYSAPSNWGPGDVGTLIFTLDEPSYIDKLYTSGWTSYESSFKFYITDIYVSGGWSGGFADGWALTKSFGTTLNIIGRPRKKLYTDLHNNGYVYSGVKKIKILVESPYLPDEGTTTRWYDIAFRRRDLFFNSGNIKSKVYKTSDVDMTYLKVEPIDETYPDNISYSGSLDKGVNWTKLSKNVFTTIGTPGNQAQIQYCFKPSGSWPTGKYSSISFLPDTPLLDSCVLTTSLNNAGSLPKSGTKIEFSDDNSFSTGDVVYPPSWSSWQTWTDPKLRLNKNDYYWLILSHASSNGEYWTYRYDPASTYTDGNIAYSWAENGVGVNWSSNSTDPTHVPSGNITFELGWKEGNITATSSSTWSIDKYGRHFKKISDSNINSLNLAADRARLEIIAHSGIKKKGTMTISGRDSMSTSFMFSANLSNYGINERFEVVSYTQRITPQEGFMTEINYGKQPYDIVKELNKLKGAVYDA